MAISKKYEQKNRPFWLVVEEENLSYSCIYQNNEL